MTRDETLQLFLMIKGNYQNFFKDMNPVTVKLTVNMWWQTLEDFDIKTVLSVVQKYSMNNTFPPTVADLRKMLVKATNPTALKSAEEAWEEVITAVRRFGYYQQSEALKMFDEPTKRAVRAIGWADICKSENIGIERANFFKMYNAFSESKRDEELLPAKLFEKLNKISEQKKLE